MTKADMQTIEVPIRLDRDEIALYSRIAQAARTDINTVLCVVLALSVTKTKPLKIETRKAKKK